MKMERIPEYDLPKGIRFPEEWAWRTLTFLSKHTDLDSSSEDLSVTAEGR